MNRLKLLVSCLLTCILATESEGADLSAISTG